MTLVIEAQAPPMQVDEYGVIRVGGTRVTLDTVIHAYQRGDTVEEIVDGFPVLKLADVHAIIAYYLNDQTAVDTYLEEQERESEKIRRKIEAQPGYHAFRERILSRYKAKNKSPEE